MQESFLQSVQSFSGTHPILFFRGYHRYFLSERDRDKGRGTKLTTHFHLRAEVQNEWSDIAVPTILLSERESSCVTVKQVIVSVHKCVSSNNKNINPRVWIPAVGYSFTEGTDFCSFIPREQFRFKIFCFVMSVIGTKRK
jgi:hypothetical protein